MNKITRVFISYSRQDSVIANRIYDALSESGLTVLLDTKDILSLEEWRPRLAEMIRGADAVLCILSSASLLSDTCKWELSFASELNKRIIPLALEDVGPRLPGSIEHINYIPFYDGADFGNMIETIQSAFDVDIGWIREHTRLGELANRWASGQALELRGKELRAAQEWLKSRPPKAPAPTPGQQLYLRASEQKARRSRYIASVVAVVIALSLSAIAFLQIEQGKMRETEAMNTVARQARSLAYRDPAAAIRLAIQSWPTASQNHRRGPADALNAVSTAIVNQRLMVVINSQKGHLLQAVFTPDRQYVVAAFSGNTIQISDAATGAAAGKPLSATGVTAAVAFSTDEKRIAVAAGNGVTIWDLETRRLLASIETPDTEVVALAFSPDGNAIITLSASGDVRFWHLETKKEFGPAFRIDDPVITLFFGSDKSTLIIATAGAIRFFDYPGGTERPGPIRLPGEITVAAVSFDGHYVAASSGNVIGIWKTASGSAYLEPLAVYPDGTEISSIAFSPDNTQIVTVTNGKSARVSAVATGGETIEIRNSHSRFTGASFSPDGTRIITSSEASVRIFEFALGMGRPVGENTAFGAVMRASQSSAAPYLGALNSHNQLVTASIPEDNMVILSDAETGQRVSGEVLHHSGIVSSVAFSPDDRFLSTADDDGIIRVWDVQTARLMFTFEHPGRAIDVSLSADFTPDSRSVVSWRKAEDMRVWNIDLPDGNLMQIACQILPFEDGSRHVAQSDQPAAANAPRQTDACKNFTPLMR